MAEYKNVAELTKQIADFKKAVNSPNSDYMTGYLCALSVTEGIIASIPTADVVEVVRCEDCIHKFDINGRCMCNINATENFGEWCGLTATRKDHFCSYGEKRSEDNAKNTW